MRTDAARHVDEPAFPAEAILVQSVLAAAHESSVGSPDEQARTLLFAWLLSLRPGSDLADSALRLKTQLAVASPADNPLLPCLNDLLDDVGNHASRRLHPRRNRRRMMRADA